MDTIKPNSFVRVCQVYCLLAITSLFATLWLPFVGEEAVYTGSSFEMWYHKHFFIPYLGSEVYGRPPLFNWSIIFGAHLAGWEHALVISRAISALCSCLTATIIAWFTTTYWNKAPIGWSAAAIYLTGDILFKRGWIAYCEPMFTLWIISSILLLLLATQKKNLLFLILSLLSVSLAFLTKAITAYTFYGIAFVVLTTQADHRCWLLKRQHFIWYLISFAIPISWILAFQSNQHQHTLVHDVLSKFQIESVELYLLRIFTHPIESIIHMLPFSLLPIYAYLKKEKYINLPLNIKENPLLWIALLNYIPYWLSPHNHTLRYVTPIYPIISVLLAYYLIENRKYYIGKIFFMLTIALKALSVAYFYLFFSNSVLINYQFVAKDILNIAKGAPLHFQYASCETLSVLFHLNILRYPKPPLARPNKYCNGYIISGPKLKGHTVVKQYQVRPDSEFNVTLYRCPNSHS